jgi:spermidine synthase
MNRNLIYLISFLSGFLSLSLEIIWLRVISFAGMSVPQAFSYTLALFLIGIAIGAYIGKKICLKNKSLEFKFIGYIFLTASVVDVSLIFFAIFKAKTSIFILVSGSCVLICAAVRGIAFPLIHHIGTQRVKSGSQISNVYFSNVLGSSLAPLLIGFIALDYLNTQQVYFFVCILTLIASGLCFAQLKNKILVSIISIMSLYLIFIPEKLFYELSKNSYQTNLYPTKIIENKNGFIQIYQENKDQVVFGSNVYDGKLNTNIFHNTNGIDRAYLLPVLKPYAKDVLVIGLSTGSWVNVLSMMPDVEKITVIEINPAYIELIKEDPIVSDILSDKRIDIIFDDGRKWVKKNSKNKYDIILMNTTWYWRAYASNLLSDNFLNILKDRVKPNGILFYNTTQSADAYFTASQVFPHTYKYKFMVLNSMQPVELASYNNIQATLCKLVRHSNQKPIFKNREECSLAVDIILETPFTPYGEIDFSEFSNRKPEMITDDNMITEYRYGKGL